MEGLVLIESGGYLVGEGQEGSGGGSVLPEAVLGFRQGEVEVEVGED